MHTNLRRFDPIELDFLQKNAVLKRKPKPPKYPILQAKASAAIARQHTNFTIDVISHFVNKTSSGKDAKILFGDITGFK